MLRSTATSSLEAPPQPPPPIPLPFAPAELERTVDDTGVVVVPAVEVASPWVLIVPSIGLGLGVPIRLRPTVEVGGRFVADAHVGPVGIMMALDYYPGMATDPRRFGVALLAHLAL